jgi:hypothetical protein
MLILLRLQVIPDLPYPPIKKYLKNLEALRGCPEWENFALRSSARCITLPNNYVRRKQF